MYYYPYFEGDEAIMEGVYNYLLANRQINWKHVILDRNNLQIYVESMYCRKTTVQFTRSSGILIFSDCGNYKSAVDYESPKFLEEIVVGIENVLSAFIKITLTV